MDAKIIQEFKGSINGIEITDLNDYVNIIADAIKK